jgi:hypothetical protein
MKAFSAINCALLSLLIHQSTNACDCIDSPTVGLSLQNEDVDYVFRGFVSRQIDMGAVSINDPKYYSVRVWQVYKGCTFSNATSIVLTTSGNSALCGINVVLNKNYVFSGRSVPAEYKVIKKAKVKNPKTFTKEMVRVAMCDFNLEVFSLSSADKELLRKQTKVC